ncbi:MAG: c-type cytochrome biogenesis protein CcmI [Proteobacteria bacterium]|nr:c-type cytochrome biogenesis protein CcmI [Pseudomonadota bacterium]
MTFWIAATLLASAIAALLLWTLARRDTVTRTAAEADIGVYRDQLAEIARDAERGTIGAAEAERSRTEIARRILEADRAMVAAAGKGGGAGPVLVPSVMVVGALAAAVLVYERVGAPGYPDMPIAGQIALAEEIRAKRPSQAEAQAAAKLPLPPPPAPDFATLMERLRKAVQERPGDLTGQELLARNETALGNFGAAAAAQIQVIGLKANDANADDYARLADLHILATGGYVSPEAELAAGEALARDPKNGPARFYLGLMWAQTGRPDHAFRLWRALLEEGPEEAPWIAPIREQIEFLAAASGVDYTPPAPMSALSGPSAEDVSAASEMSAADRAEMIKGMVVQLSERLYSQGGSPEEWARLISSLGVLGDKDKAKEAWGKAQAAFAGQDAAIEALRQAAAEAGVEG